MARTIDATGRSIDEAIFNGLKELEISIDEVEIDIIQQESKGILGIGAKPAIVRLTEREPEDVVLPEYLNPENQRRERGERREKRDRRDRRDRRDGDRRDRAPRREGGERRGDKKFGERKQFSAGPRGPQGRPYQRPAAPKKEEGGAE